MASVETVRGPVALGDLGRTLMHEHVIHHAAGGAPELGARLRSGLLGRAGADRRRGREAHAGARRKEAIGDLFIREIREGIDDTGVKAAFLKCAVDRHGLVGDVPRIHEAIAMAATETGAPVMVHTNAEQRTGLLALDALARHGVDPGQVVIAHAGDSNDLDYLRTIAHAGAWLGCDRFGIDHFNPLADRIRTLIALVEDGYADRIHLSHDAACFMDFFVANPFFANEKPDYLLISNKVLPALLEGGVTQDRIDQMTVGNPMRFFGGEAMRAGAPGLLRAAGTP